MKNNSFVNFKFDYNQFKWIIDGGKIELNDGYIYENVLNYLWGSCGSRYLLSILNSNRKVDGFVFEYKDNESSEKFALKYSLDDIANAYLKTKFSIGINTSNKKHLKDYFKRYVKDFGIKQKDKKNIVKDN